VARMESGRITLESVPFPMRELLQECSDMVAAQADGKGVKIIVGEENHKAVGDRGKLKQVVLNLLTNAIKYNRPSGTIHLNLEPQYAGEESMLQVEVKDTGYGISREHQKNMFQKFYRVPTLENVARGTGLGLAICKNMVEAHGGRIWLESEVDVGSSFFFTVPLLN
jgi:signal transduction histidine kinase